MHVRAPVTCTARKRSARATAASQPGRRSVCAISKDRVTAHNTESGRIRGRQGALVAPPAKGYRMRALRFRSILVAAALPAIIWAQAREAPPGIRTGGLTLTFKTVRTGLPPSVTSIPIADNLDRPIRRSVHFGQNGEAIYQVTLAAGPAPGAFRIQVTPLESTPEYRIQGPAPVLGRPPVSTAVTIHTVAGDTIRDYIKLWAGYEDIQKIVMPPDFRTEALSLASPVIEIGGQTFVNSAGAQVFGDALWVGVAGSQGRFIVMLDSCSAAGERRTPTYVPATVSDATISFEWRGTPVKITSSSPVLPGGTQASVWVYFDSAFNPERAQSMADNLGTVRPSHTPRPGTVLWGALPTTCF